MPRPMLPVVCAFLLVASGCIGLGGDTAPSPAADLNTPASTAVTESETDAPASPTTTADSAATPTRTGRSTQVSTAAPTITKTRTPTPTPTATRSPTSTPEQPGLQVTVTVTRVVDGDTIKIAYRNGSADTVRLLGVDTPEVHTDTDPTEFEGVPDTSAGRECLRAEGTDASTYVTDALAGETVTLRFDDAADRRGYYGRLLAYVLVDGRNVNYRLVADGYARVYDSTFTQSDRFYSAESDAQAAERGLWRCQDVATATPTPDSIGDGELVVTRVHADAAGNDHTNENDEYVVFENTGDGTLELTGWTVSDEADHTYRFPDDFTLESGATVTLHTGSGTDTETDLYWGSDSAIWNNGGDTVIVTDASGSVVVRHEYSR